MSPPKMKSKDLPVYLRKRIKIDAGREDRTCWHWTGKARRARERYRPYTSTVEHPELRENAGRRTAEAATPLVRHPITKNEEDARRHVYAAATMTPVCDVPTLKRFCAEPLCVNPHHVVPGAPTAAQRKRAEGHRPETLPAEPVEYTHDRCMEMLRAASGGAGVDPNVDRENAADEAGIPPDQLTEATWAAYVREEEGQ